MISWLCSLVVPLLLFILPIRTTGKQVRNGSRPLSVEILTVAWMKTDSMGSYPFIGPAFDTGLSDMAQWYPDINFTHSVIYDASFQSCPDWAAESDNRLAEFYYRHRQRNDAMAPDLTVFLLAGCRDFNGVLRFGTGLNNIVLSTGATSPFIYDKSNFPTFITADYVSATAYTTIYQRLVQRYNWTTIMMMLDTIGNPGHAAISRHIESELVAMFRTQISIDFVTGNFSSRTAMDRVLQRFKITSRVMLLFADASPIRDLLRFATAHNLTDGSFVFILTFAIKYGTSGTAVYHYFDEQDAVIKRAFRVCLVLTLDPNILAIRRNLSDSWKQLSSLKYNYTYGPSEKMSPTVTSTYAAVTIMGQVIDSVHRRLFDFDWSNGAALAKEFFNRTFATTIGRVTFSEFGERLTPMSFDYYDPESDQFAAFVQLDANHFRVVRDPSWPTSWPVANEPKCGFRGDRIECHKTDGQTPVIAGCAGFAAIITCIIAVYFASRHILFRAALLDDVWQLDYCQLRLRSRRSPTLHSSNFRECKTSQRYLVDVP